MTTVDITTTAGIVRGRWRGPASAAFLGIPFAEPPVGELRYAAPVPHHAWHGVREAFEYGPTAQRRQLMAVTTIPEPSLPGDSTLNVNVFTPSPGPTAKLPVLVYIHGGGYTAGSPASPWYDGAAFNRDGVVTVTISYRLGFDGFGLIDDAPANRAVRDWLLALRWVQDNIASFGGDPGNVTIAGQSAGGAAVLTLLGTPAARGLFRRGFALSGVDAVIRPDRAREITARMARLAGVLPTLDGFRSLDEATVLDLQDRVAGFGATPDSNADTAVDPLDPVLAPLRGMIDGGLGFAPVIDGDLVMGSVFDDGAIATGPGAALLLGATDDEFSMITAEFAEALDSVPAAHALSALGLTGDVADAYLAANDANRPTSAVLGRYLTDRMFREPALRLARTRAATPTWLYRFSWPSPALGQAIHCLDIPFVFDCLGAEGVTAVAGDEPPQHLADQMHAAAVAFVRSGDPGWDRFAPDTESAMVWDTAPELVTDAYASVDPLVGVK